MEQRRRQSEVKDTLVLIHRILQLKYETYIASLADESSLVAGEENLDKSINFRLELLQQLVDSAFNLATYNHASLDIDGCHFLLRLLSTSDPYIDAMIEMSSLESKGTAIYYKFKLYEFIANLHKYIEINRENSEDDSIDHRTEYIFDSSVNYLNYLSKAIGRYFITI